MSVVRERRAAPAPTLSGIRAFVLVLLTLAALGLLAVLAHSALAAPPPAPVLTAGPVGPGADSTPTWQYTLPAPAPDTTDAVTVPATGTVTTQHAVRGECALTTALPPAPAEFGAGAPCDVDLAGSPSYTAGVETDGPVYFSVRAVQSTTTTYTDDNGVVLRQDVSRETSTVTSSAAYVYDGQPPAVTLTGPTGGRTRTPHFDLTLVDGTATTLACTVDGAPVSCSPAGGLDVPALGTDGDHEITVSATDDGGRSTTRTASYRLDTGALVSVSPAAQSSADRSPSWSFAGAEPWVTATCELTTGGVVVQTGPCSSLRTHTAATLPPTAGTDYTLTVTVTDAAGNSGSASASYRLDTVTSVTVSPASRTGNDRTPVWSLSGDAIVSASCTLSTGGTVMQSGACSSLTSHTADILPPTAGTSYQLTVTVTDGAGNTGTATATYRLDTVLQLTVVGPSSPSTLRTPAWSFNDEPYSSVTCTLVGPSGPVSGGECGLTGYTAPLLPGTTGADYRLSVQASDGAGNIGTVTSAVLHLDTVLELVVSGPSGPAPQRAPVFSFAGELFTALSCTLTGPDGGTVPAGECSQTGTAPTLGVDGLYTLVVTAQDAAGNSRSVTVTYELDTLAFTLAGPTGPSTDRSPRWSFLDEPYTSATCTLQGPAGVVFSGPCTTLSSYIAPPLPLTAAADYTLTVTVVDRGGNTGTRTTPPYRLDTQAPSVSVAGPVAPGRVGTVTWTVSSDEPSSGTCVLLRDGLVVLTDACPGTISADLPGDGTYTLQATVTDAAGNSGTGVSAVYVYIAQAPVAPTITPTATISNVRSAVWNLSGPTGTTLSCRLRLDGVVLRDWTPCGSSFSALLATDGSYLLQVRATDAVGPGAVASASYLLDTVSPSAPSVTGPAGPARSRVLTWTLAVEIGSTARCRVSRGGTPVLDFVPCAAPSYTVTLTGQVDGTYVLEVEVRDAAGNVSSGFSGGFLLDTTAPEAPQVAGPVGPSPQRSPRFTWNSEPGSTSECSLGRDGVAGAFLSCVSGFTPALPGDGTWTLTVRLVDAAGNVSAATTSVGYTLDTTAPVQPVVVPPRSPGRDRNPSWAVTAEPGSSLECRLSGPGGVLSDWRVCLAPVVTALNLPDGRYQLEVRATDAAGNVGTVGAGSYLLDTTAPGAPVVTATSSTGRSRTPSFTVTAEPGSTLRCRLTSGSTLIQDSTDCASPVSLDLTGLPDGAYALQARVVDAAGNTGPAGSAVYVLDTAAPAAPAFTVTPGGPAPGTRPTWSFVAEAGVTYLCRVSSPAGAVREIAGCQSPLTLELDGQPDGTYQLTVRAVDAAGNVGLAATGSYTVSAAAPAVPVVTGPLGPSTSRTPSWSVSGPGTLECQLSRPGVAPKEFAACVVSNGRVAADLFGLVDGVYVLSVRSRVGAVLSAVTGARYVLDTTAPAAPAVVGPYSPGTDSRPIWVVSATEVGARVECRLLVLGAVLRDWAPCGAGSGTPVPFALTRGDGSYTLVVRQVDQAGNIGPEEAATYVLNTAAPGAVAVEAPASPSADTAPVWRLVTVPGTLLECRLSGPDGPFSGWSGCANTFTGNLQDRPDGTYTLSVRAVSAAGTPGPETTAGYVLLRTLPGGPTNVTGPARSPGADRRPVFTFTLPAGSDGYCVVTRGTVQVFAGSCGSPYTLTLDNAPDGTYTVKVSARNRAGSLSSSAGVASYTLLTTPPAAPVFTLRPGAGGSGLVVTWRFTVERGVTTQCRLLRDGSLVGEDWTACNGDYVALLSGRPDGRYQLQVRAVGAAGSTSQPRSDDYELNRSAVAVPVFAPGPVSPGATRAPSWTFSAPAGGTLQCRVTGPSVGEVGFTPCGSATVRDELITERYLLNATVDGEWRLEVRVVDDAGRVGQAATATYVLDTVKPPRVELQPGQATAGSSPTPSFAWDEPASDLVQCRLLRDGVPQADWAECAGGTLNPQLREEGAWTFEVRRVDQAGNVGPVSAMTYVFDRTPPLRPTFLTRPPAAGTAPSTSWTFTVPRDGTRAVCTVTRGGQVVLTVPSCSSPFVLSLAGQPVGVYVLSVLLLDAAGNSSAPLLGTYRYAAASSAGPVRVDPPPRVGPPAPVQPPSSGPGRAGTGPPKVRPPTVGAPVAPALPLPGRQLEQLPPRRITGPLPKAPTQPLPVPAAKPAAGPDVIAPGPPSVADVPQVIQDVVARTIKRPALPLALVLIVVLFLLAQNRIDRRDPKLALDLAAGDTELTFGPLVRRPGGAA